MTQAQKTLLRYQYVMANTKMIQGDSARTADTWANSLRRLKQNFEALGATVGNIIVNTFKPVLHWMNQAIQNLNAFVKTVGNALGAIFGWTIESTPGALSDDAYGDIADAMEGAADGAGDLDAGTAGAAGVAVILGAAVFADPSHGSRSSQPARSASIRRSQGGGVRRSPAQSWTVRRGMP